MLRITEEDEEGEDCFEYGFVDPSRLVRESDEEDDCELREVMWMSALEVGLRQESVDDFEKRRHFSAPPALPAPAKVSHKHFVKEITIHLDTNSMQIPEVQTQFFEQRDYCTLRMRPGEGFDASLHFRITESNQAAVLQDYFDFTDIFTPSCDLAVAMKCELMTAGLGVSEFLEESKIRQDRLTALNAILALVINTYKLNDILAVFPEYQHVIFQFVSKNFQRLIKSTDTFSDIMRIFPEPENRENFANLFFYSETVKKISPAYNNKELFALLKEFPELNEHIVQFILNKFSEVVRDAKGFEKILKLFPNHFIALSDKCFARKGEEGFKLYLEKLHFSVLARQDRHHIEHLFKWCHDHDQLDSIIDSISALRFYAKHLAKSEPGKPHYQPELYHFLRRPNRFKKMIANTSALLEAADSLPDYRTQLLTLLNDQKRFFKLTRNLPNLIIYAEWHPADNALLFYRSCKPALFMKFIQDGWDVDLFRKAFPLFDTHFGDCTQPMMFARMFGMWRAPIKGATYGALKNAKSTLFAGNVAPKDVAEEISDYLHPADGARLARTCKEAYRLAYGVDVDPKNPRII